MKRRIVFILVLCFAVSTLTGCRKPPKVDKFVEIASNETAFVIPLEGKTSKQGQLLSLDYLEKNKVAVKRIFIPKTEKKTGRYSWNIEWIDSVKVITVNRSPITREWTIDKTTGTEAKDDAISVESKDSIGFSIGVNITAMITEKDTALFLYRFAGADLKTIVDKNVRGYVASILSQEFGSRPLQKCKDDKKDIASLCFQQVKEHFEPMGVTIDNLGFVEGLTYDKAEIQKAIDDAYIAEMDVIKARQEKFAQDERNKITVALAVTEKQAAEEFAKAQEAQVARVKLEVEKMKAQALLEASKRWNGSTPSSILPEGSSFLFGLDTASK